MLYAFVLPVVELFVGTYIMRNKLEPGVWCMGYQPGRLHEIPLTFW